MEYWYLLWPVIGNDKSLHRDILLGIQIYFIFQVFVITSFFCMYGMFALVQLLERREVFREIFFLGIQIYFIFQDCHLSAKPAAIC